MPRQEADDRRGNPARIKDRAPVLSPRFHFGLRLKIFLALGSLLAVFVILNVLIVSAELGRARERAVSEAAQAARLVGLSVGRHPGEKPAGLFARNPAALREFVGNAARELKRRVILLDPQGRVLADSASELPDLSAWRDEGGAVGRALADGRPRLVKAAGSGPSAAGERIVVPVIEPGRPASGAVILDFSDSFRAQRARIMKDLAPFLVVDLMLIVILLLGARILSQGLTHPLRALAKTAVRLGQGNLNQPITVSRRDEIGSLAASLEKMRGDLARSAHESKTEIAEQRRVEDGLQAAHAELTHQLAELKRHAEEMKNLSWIGEALHKASTPEECYTSVAPIIPKLFPDHSGGLFLFGRSHLEVKAVALWGDPEPDEKDLARLDLMALRSGHSPQAFLPRPEGGPRTVDTSAGPGGHLCVPVDAKGDVLGFLYLQHSRASASGEAPPLTEVHYLALTVADQFALAVSNIKLRETLRQQSIRDPLTGLFNRRYLDETMEREFHRCRRLEAPLSVVMLDIDHFKAFNDTYGHEAGDAALTTLGMLFRKSIRGSDIACRYGGEEFILILPGASLEDSRQRAEKIRAEVEQKVVEYQGEPCGPLTVSIGVASFPSHGKNPSEVILAADGALYGAKNEGRNRVVTAGTRTPERA